MQPEQRAHLAAGEMDGVAADRRWLLLIYTVPAVPSRLRAAVWRDLKKVGAVYLRDGVCVLPERQDTASEFTELATRVHELGGRATLVRHVQLDDERAAEVLAQVRADRLAEFSEVRREAQRFLEHVRRERVHREFSYPEVEQLDVDLGKLKRWADQVRARNYFGASEAAVDAVLAQCVEALGAFLEDANAVALANDEAPM